MSSRATTLSPYLFYSGKKRIKNRTIPANSARRPFAAVARVSEGVACCKINLYIYTVIWRGDAQDHSCRYGLLLRGDRDAG